MKHKLTLNSFLINRLLLILIGLLFVLALGSTKGILSLLGNNSNKLVSLKAKSQALQQEKTYLVSAEKEVKKYSPLQQIAETIVPQDKDQAQTVREIVNLAQQNNITLTNIGFPSSSLGAPTTTAPKAATSSISLSQLTPVKGIPGVYVLPIQVQDDQTSDAVSYTHFYNFLTDLEQNRRTCLVTGLSIKPLPGGLITFSLTINEYIKPK